ncbi:preprotein translocase subunit SecG [Gilvimarinus sp. SDUM040013]|uniref:Protein-export membrane protein SecG n=1 Tax=Gilvimarinus gilvus TaxID=3058038 RepID=A0ABU4S0T3_9GAMM|nr:preprotein translocase subunit SecG [Gilvimarinus sp. SDUM040013]MDO3387204.1 preprotein translocase subunit SecG [Gilvimarinus sp. SDUM040013]MDX6850767.1 preprotein translocase subunit SecG [Gilvimarinus sp. SDUM040013]
MEKIVLIVHMLTALAIIALILMQQGKGASAGASFGAGASQTVFGSEGSGNFFTRTTAIFAFVFFCTSFGLAIIAKNSANITDVGIPAMIDSAPAMSDVPAAEQSDSDVPSVGAEENGSDVPAVPAE